MNNNHTCNNPDYTRYNRSYNFMRPSISWGAIAAGVVTSLITAMLLSLLFIGLGFSNFDINAQDAGTHSGLALGLGSIVIMILSLFAGGYLSGMLSGRSGGTHGFLTWATLSLVAFLLSAMAITSALQFSGSLIGGAFTAGATGDAKTTQHEVNKEIDHTVKAYAFSDDFLDSYRSQLNSALDGGKAPVLSIDKLKNSLASARNQLSEAAKEGYNTPDSLKAIGDRLKNSLQRDIDGLNFTVTQTEVSKQLINNGMAKEKAQTVAQNALNIFNAAKADSRKKIVDAKNFVDKGLYNGKNLPDQAVQIAGDATNKAGHGALWACFSAVLGALVSALAGSMGTKKHTVNINHDYFDNGPHYDNNGRDDGRDYNGRDYTAANAPVTTERVTTHRILGDDISPRV
ncbi:YrzE family protein [Bartonella sp. TP]|uniref:TIGR04086 family membrane protein n=1 Tax=Bartonella sp. TP TaxID=3057550 RepID=UPI0025B03AA7|nr:YrzE family protein [Bartonella sp. TP]WJW79971.1 YrzE family protein [Bartonella sp. TP]